MRQDNYKIVNTRGLNEITVMNISLILLYLKNVIIVTEYRFITVINTKSFFYYNKSNLKSPEIEVYFFIILKINIFYLRNNNVWDSIIIYLTKD